MVNIKSKRFLKGGLIAIFGFLLSPLSWWNDLLINIPLAYALAVAANHLVPGHFPMYMILFYWLTNVAGLVLMHRGGELALKEEGGVYSTRALIKDIVISLIYSIVIGGLVVLGILKLPQEYFG